MSMNHTAFLNLVLPFKDKLYRMAKRLLISNEEAEDATQEILLKLWANKSKIGTYKNAEAFAMTMTKNYCFDRLKSKQAQNLRIVHSNYKDETAQIQKQVEHIDSIDWVEKLMQQLPVQQRLGIGLLDPRSEINVDFIFEFTHMMLLKLVQHSLQQFTIADQIINGLGQTTVPTRLHFIEDLRQQIAHLVSRVFQCLIRGIFSPSELMFLCKGKNIRLAHLRQWTKNVGMRHTS